MSETATGLEPELQRISGLDDPLLAEYLQFVAARASHNTLLAQAFDLKVFFSIVDVPVVEVRPTDVLEFVTHQRSPRRGVNIVQARAFCQRFFAWYSHEHRHSGIGWHTPASVHYGTAEQIRAQRGKTLDAAYQAHPERFVRQPPTPPQIQETIWINQPVGMPARSGPGVPATFGPTPLGLKVT